MIAPSLTDLPQGFDPAALAQEGLDPLVQKLVGLGSATLILILLALAVVVFLVRWIRARIRPPTHAPGPTWVAAALLIIGVYLFALLLDLLLINLVDRPSWFPAERWGRRRLVRVEAARRPHPLRLPPPQPRPRARPARPRPFMDLLVMGL
jgi:hypothetical protein